MIRVFRHYVPRTLVILGTSEALILFASIYVGVAVPLTEFNPTSNLLAGPLWTRGLVYAALMLVVMASVGLYQRDLRDDLRGLLFRIGVAFLIGLAILTGLLALAPSMTIGTTALSLTFACSVVGVMVFRAIMYRYAHTGLFRRRVMILGAGQSAAQIERLRRTSDWQDIALVGYVHVPGEQNVVDESKIISWNGTLYDLVRMHGADEIVVAIGDRRRHFPINDILDCKMRGVRITDVVGFFERQTGKINVEALSPSTMIFADGFIQAVIKTTSHRLVDVVLSLVLLAAAWPLMLLAAIGIWLESGFRGPILYRQTRVGRDGEHFEILKFRSMTVDAERGGVRWAAPGDSRVTRVGAVIRKTRIDELPQIINVLRGEMSFVGPRPERPEFVAELEKEIPFYGLRHRVNPGITGWAQICYPYGASLEDAKEKLEYDLYYIKNYSLFLDLMILIQTAQVIFLGKGAR